jgi:hypothetical protein
MGRPLGEGLAKARDAASLPESTANAQRQSLTAMLLNIDRDAQRTCSGASMFREKMVDAA